VSIGSIFAIWKRKSAVGTPHTEDDWKRNGKDIEATGYCLYGSSTHFLLALPGKVSNFTLDPSLGEFILTHKDMKIPNGKSRKTIYSINDGNAKIWDTAITEYIQSVKFPASGSPYSSRYIGSMVADVHRTILYGGIFLYPADTKSPSGKLRVLYECFPMAYIIE
jgi:fructose-1,6-bisphosphatase I